MTRKSPGRSLIPPAAFPFCPSHSRHRRWREPSGSVWMAVPVRPEFDLERNAKHSAVRRIIHLVKHFCPARVRAGRIWHLDTTTGPPELQFGPLRTACPFLPIGRSALRLSLVRAVVVVSRCARAGGVHLIFQFEIRAGKIEDS